MTTLLKIGIQNALDDVRMGLRAVLLTFSIQIRMKNGTRHSVAH